MYWMLSQKDKCLSTNGSRNVQAYHTGPLGRVQLTETLDDESYHSFRSRVGSISRHIADVDLPDVINQLTNKNTVDLTPYPEHIRNKIYDALVDEATKSEHRAVKHLESDDRKIEQCRVAIAEDLKFHAERR